MKLKERKESHRRRERKYCLKQLILRRTTTFALSGGFPFDKEEEVGPAGAVTSGHCRQKYSKPGVGAVKSGNGRGG